MADKRYKHLPQPHVTAILFLSPRTRASTATSAQGSPALEPPAPGPHDCSDNRPYLIMRLE